MALNVLASERVRIREEGIASFRFVVRMQQGMVSLVEMSRNTTPKEEIPENLPIQAKNDGKCQRE